MAVTALAASILSAGSVGVACAMLSPLVVNKRWAFIGEGIAHAGFAGAGTAWLAALLFPSAAAWLASDLTVYVAAVVSCIVVAALIGWLTLSRRGGVQADTAIGIFMVASLAWGFLSYAVYAHVTHAAPPQFAQYLGFEPLRAAGWRFVALTVVTAACVSAVIWMVRRPLLYWAFDAESAATSGVPIRVIHLLVVGLLTLVIVVGMRVTGTVLVVAMLVLPGATAMQLARSTAVLWGVSVTVGVVGAVTGPLISLLWPVVPEGPAIVLSMFVMFLAGFAANRTLLNRRTAAARLTSATV
jgi:ABC-type Mn2+/Zn2+ transport system permease subunit